MNYKKIIASIAILGFCFLSFSFVNTVKAAPPVITTLTVVTPPANTNGSVDNALQTQPVINVKDETNTDMAGVTVSAVLVDGTGSLVAGNTAITDANGNATFTGLQYNKSGETFTIKFAAGLIETAKSADITAITPGITTTFIVAGITDPVVAGTAVGAFTVTAKDQYNNTAIGYNGTVTFTSSDPVAILPSDYTFVAGDNGVATISGLILKTAGEQTVTASDGAITGAQTGITVTHDIATKYIIINPTDGTVDNPITVTVQLQDQYNNIVTTGADKDKGVTLVTDGSATGAGLVTISNGVGTLNISNTLPETINLSLTDSQGTAFNVSSIQDVVFAHGVATKVVFNQEPSTPTVAGIPFATQPIVAIQDQYDNVITSDNTSNIIVKAFTTSDCLTPATPDLSGTLNVQASAGTGTFSGISYTKTSPGNLYVKASVGGLSVCSGALTITPATANSLIVESITNPITAGASSDVKVTAIDWFGNIDTNYIGTIKFSVLTDTKLTTILPADYTFIPADNGVKTFSNGVVLTTAGTHNVVASDTVLTSIKGIQTGIVVNNATATKYIIINPTDGTVDNPITVTVQLQDQYNNIVTTGPDKDKNVTLITNSSSGTGIFLITISNGVGTKDISNQKAETVGLSLFDGGSTGFNVSSIQDVVFAHGVATKVVFNQEPSTPTVAGIPFATQPIVAIQDQYDNVITSDNTSSIVIKAYNNPGCSIAANPDLNGTLSVQVINGISTFSGISYTKTSLGNLYVKASVGGLSVCSGVKTITPATASRFTVEGISDPIVAGIPSNVIVTALDSFDNIDTNYAGTVRFTSSDVKSTTILPADYTFVPADNGVKTFFNWVVLTTAGEQSVSVNDTVLTAIKGIQRDITVTNASGSKYVIIDPTDGTVDNPIAVTVQLLDQYNNIVTTGADKDKDVTLVTDGSASGAGLVDIVNGVGTLNISNTLPETINLSLTDTQGTTFNVSSTQNVVFAPGVATELYFSVQPSYKAYTYVKFGIQPTVVLRDQFGNVRSDVNAINLLVDTVDNTCLNAAANADFVGTKTQPAGTSFVGLKYNKIDTDGIWLCATSGALTGVSNKIAVYTSGAPSTSGGSGTPVIPTTTTTTTPKGEVLGAKIEAADDFDGIPQPSKPIAQMTRDEKNTYIIQLQSYLIKLLTQLFEKIKK